MATKYRTRSSRTKYARKSIAEKWEDHYYDTYVKPYMKYSHNAVMCNKNITMRTIENHPEFPWNTDLAMNPNLTFKFIQEHLDVDWRWTILSRHKCITLEIIDKYNNDPNYHWDIIGISANPNLTIEYIRSHPDAYWDYGAISKNSTFTIEDIETNSDLPWDYPYICLNPNVSLDFIKKRVNYLREKHHYSDKDINLNIDWNFLAKNPAISLRDIEENLSLPWKGQYLSSNPNLTLELIKCHPEIQWNNYNLAKNPNINYKELVPYVRKMNTNRSTCSYPYQWSENSLYHNYIENPNVSLEFISSYLNPGENDKKKYLSTITYDFIYINPFDKIRETFIEKEYNKYLMAYRIQQYYLTAQCDPYCRIGLRKVNRDYDECFNEDGSIKLPADFKLI